MSSPKVILIEKNERYPLEKAEAFGEVKFITERYINPFNVTEAVEVILAGLDRFEFDPKRDYICMTGQMLKISFLLSVAFGKYESVQVLMWDAKNHDYRLRKLDMSTINPHKGNSNASRS